MVKCVNKNKISVGGEKMRLKTPEEIQQEKKREERRLRIKNDIALIVSGSAMLITAIAYILFILQYKS